MQRARPAACGVVLETYGVGLARGQLLRADDCDGPPRVVVGIAHAVAVDVARFQRCAPTAVVVGGRGVAVGVLHARNELVQHAVVGVFVAHALALVVGGLGERGQVAVGVVGVVHGGAHAALPCVVVDRLPDGDERREHARAVVALPYRLVGVEGALQPVALRVVQRLGGDEVVHVQVAVVSVLGHLRAVGGIVLLGVQLSGDDLGEPEEVALAPVAVAALVGV